MSRREPESRHDLEHLLGQLGQEESVAPAAEFRSALKQMLSRQLAPRRGVGDLPEGWALCPFDVFCIAEQRLPLAMKVNCPCLRGAALLRALKGRGPPVHARPCTGRRLPREPGAGA